MKTKLRLQNFLFNTLETGTFKTEDILVKNRIYYFNAILIALPIVYTVFVSIDISSYLKPPKLWYFDQFSFIIFISICAISFILNYFNKTTFSKVFFILTWPVIMHIAPIIIQETPSDYYYAFPMGLVFHSLMIQVIFCSIRSGYYFWTLLMFNFIFTIYSVEFLKYFDTDVNSAIGRLAAEEYYILVIILYWLLFNLVVFSLMRIIDNNLLKTLKSKKIIEMQKNELEETLDKLKQSQNQLVQSEKMASLGIFTAGISHELNNPINYVSSGVYALFDLLDSLYDENFKGKKEYEVHFQNIQKMRSAIENGVDKASSIISSLSKYTHPGKDEFEMHNSISCLADSITLLYGSIKDRIRIKKEYPEKIEIVCNPVKLNQVFFNILNNAVQSISEKGEIVIKGYFNGNEEAVFEFIDNGCGIEKDHLNKLFDPFFTTKEIGKGTGLGLYIVHKIIEEHKGRIEMDSEINKGTLFRIILPKNPLL